MEVPWTELACGLALLLVVEGFMPFLSPGRFRKTLLNMASLEDRWLRGLGLVSMLAGLLILNLVLGG